MLGKIKLGVEEWKKLETELQRIAGGEQLEIVISLTLVSSADEGEEEEEEEEGHYHHHHFVENEFTKEVSGLIDHLAHTYNAHVHPHLHSNHGTITLSIKGEPKYLVKSLKDIIEFVKLNCEKCVLHSLDGEFHIGEDLAGIYFGDAYKITVILPASDGRRLIVHELHF